MEKAFEERINLSPLLAFRNFNNTIKSPEKKFISGEIDGYYTFASENFRLKISKVGHFIALDI